VSERSNVLPLRLDLRATYKKPGEPDDEKERERRAAAPTLQDLVAIAVPADQTVEESALTLAEPPPSAALLSAVAASLPPPRAASPSTVPMGDASPFVAMPPAAKRQERSTAKVRFDTERRRIGVAIVVSALLLAGAGVTMYVHERMEDEAAVRSQSPPATVAPAPRVIELPSQPPVTVSAPSDDSTPGARREQPPKKKRFHHRRRRH
jgi:hypothetical protein